MLGSLGIQMVRSKTVWLLAVVVVAATVGLLVIPGRGGTAEPALAGTSLHGKSAPDFRLTDQFGRRIRMSQFRDHPVVATFLEAHCRETCPLVADKLRQALTTLGAAGRQVAILVVSTAPEGDTISAVRQFSRTRGMLHRWHYLVGSRRQLSRIWRAYFIYAAPKNAPPAIRDVHTSATFLIDRQGRE
jgi:cytochrome oxidase Cu insertion factor (SCO1/SenC/PrrC family)